MKRHLLTIASVLILTFGFAGNIAVGLSQESLDCEIPQDAPLALTADVTTSVTVQCVDGELVVSQSSTGAVEPYLSPQSENGILATHVCHGRSTAYDNSVFDIVMTWYDVSFVVYYDGSTAAAVGDARQNWFAQGNTG